MPLCKGITKLGLPCKRAASRPGGWCHDHVGQDTWTGPSLPSDEERYQHALRGKCSGFTLLKQLCKRGSAQGGYCYQHIGQSYTSTWNFYEYCKRRAPPKQKDETTRQSRAQTSDAEHNQEKARVYSNYPRRAQENTTGREDQNGNRVDYEPRNRAKDETSAAEKKARRTNEKLDEQSRARFIAYQRAMFPRETRAAGTWTKSDSVSNYLKRIGGYLETKQGPITFNSIPWPILTHPHYIALNDITWENVEAFFGYARISLPATDFRRVLKASQSQFHPDRWAARSILDRIKDDLECQCASHAGLTVSQAIGRVIANL